jgi:hypothetical protein
MSGFTPLLLLYAFMMWIATTLAFLPFFWLVYRDLASSRSGMGGMDWIDLAQDRDRWRAV